MTVLEISPDFDGDATSNGVCDDVDAVSTGIIKIIATFGCGYIRFPLTSLPEAGVVIDSAELQIELLSILVNGTTVIWTAYGNGQDDPEADACADRYAKSDTPVDEQPYNVTSFAGTVTPATLTFPLTANIGADILAAKWAGTKFSLAANPRQIGSETVHAMTWEPIESGNGPKLRLVYHQVAAPVPSGQRVHRALISDRWGTTKGQIIG